MNIKEERIVFLLCRRTIFKEKLELVYLVIANIIIIMHAVCK